MNNNSFYPPNMNSTNNGVIAPVMQHARRLPNQTDGRIITTNELHNFQDCLALDQVQEFVVAVQNERITTFGSVSGHKLLESTRRSPRSTSTPLALDNQTIEMVRAQAQADLELRRRRNRMHQAKHKLRQKEKVVDLENTIVQLRKEIQQLTLKRLQTRVVSATTLVNTSVWNVAAEYFRVFRDGYKAPVWRMESSVDVAGCSEPLIPVEAHEQKDFVLDTMTPDIAGDRGYGVEAILDDWKQLSLLLNDLHIQLERLENSGDGVIASVKSTATLTDATIRCAFPQLVNGEDLYYLTEALRGQQLVMHGWVRFDWDEKKSRVSSVQYDVDILTPIMKLVGNLEDAFRVFNRALITPQSKLVV